MDANALWEAMEARRALGEPTLALLARAHDAEMDHRPDDATSALAAIDRSTLEPALARVARLLALRVDVRRGDPASATRAIDEASSLAAATAEEATRIRAHHLVAVAAIRLGKLAEAEEALGRVLDHPLPVPFQYWVIDSFAQVLSGQGAWVEAIRAMRALVELRRRAGDAIGVAITAGNLARVHAELGDLARAGAVAEDALKGLGDGGSALTRLRLQTWVTSASALPGADAAARGAAVAALERALAAAASSHHYLAGYAALALARAASADGDASAAERWLARARADVSSPGQRLLVLHHEAIVRPERLDDPAWIGEFERIANEAHLVGEGEMRIRLALAERAPTTSARAAALDAAYARAAASNHPLWTHWLDELAARIDPALHGERLARRFSGWAANELRATRREDVTIVFSDLVSFTARSLELSPEEVMDTVRGLFELAVPVMTRHGVGPITYLGDGLLAIARGPDHERRGLAFAREFLARTTRLSLLRAHLGDRWALDIRAGVASGPVVLGALGTYLKLDFAAIGLTTNLAARLQGVASPREIVCDERTAIAAGVDLPLEEVALKGFEKLGTLRACRLR